MESKQQNDEPQPIGDESAAKRTEMLRLTLVAAAVALSWVGVWRAFLPIDLVAIMAILAGGYPVYKETFHALRHGHVNMEVSMAVAILAALLVGQFTVSAVITFFVLLSEFIEGYAVEKGRQTIVLLEESAPKKALVKRGDGTEAEVDAESLATNDVVIVRHGERVPVDGTITAGSAFVNQSALTGESARVEKGVGDKVYAGSINESGMIEVRTERVGKETVFGKIIRLIEEAESRKAPIQRIADRLATWLVEFAIGFSLLTFVVTQNVITALSVVVVAGACGVAAGTPLAIVAIMGKAAKKGAIIKGGAYVEEMNRIDTVVIDKTGTLTFGEPFVTEIVPFNGSSERQVIEYATAAEKRSSHPLARAIIARAREMGIDASESSPSSLANYIPGKGMVLEQDGEEIVVGNSILMSEREVSFPGAKTSQLLDSSHGRSIVLVARAGQVCGAIAIADRVRAESKRAVADLRALGFKTIMLTGDNKSAAEEVAREVGIDEVHAELLPEDKVAFVEKFVAAGHRVAMVGDGINDAPALARANVGIGMGGGTDVAIEEADIVLMTNDLQKIADVAKLSRKAYRTIMVNFYGTLTVDGVGITLAFLGMLNPLLAAAIHVISELIFILNSAKLIR